VRETDVKSCRLAPGASPAPCVYAATTSANVAWRLSDPPPSRAHSPWHPRPSPSLAPSPPFPSLESPCLFAHRSAPTSLPPLAAGIRYTSGGCFTPHEDDQSITLLLNLSQRAAYTGGGTAFWSLEDGGGPGKGPTLPESQLPSHLIAPAVGTALIFGGQVTHAARPVLTGERIVFVASFSPVSRKGPKRTRALQAGLAGLRIAAARQAGGHPGSRQREFGTPSPDGAAPSPEAEHASAAAPSSATMEDTSLEELCRALSRSEEAALREPPAMAWMLAHEEEVD